MLDTFFAFLKKTMVAIVFVIFGFAAAYAPVTYTNHSGEVAVSNVEIVHAGGVPSWVDIANWIENTGSHIVEAADYVLQNWLQLKEASLDGIAWAIAKQIISNMVASIVDWINSGFQGSPAFVQNLGDFLLQAADEAVGIYLNELDSFDSFVCSPFRLDIQLSLAIWYDAERDMPPSCTLTSIINNFEQFIEGDFTQGGWEGWFDLVAQPKSLPYGSVLEARGEARRRIVNAQGEERSLLGFGEGFFSATICSTTSGPGGQQENCSITLPGKAIADQLNNSLGAGTETLIEADEINEIIAALLGQLAQQAITGAAGLLGLSGGTGQTYSGYSRGSFVADLQDGAINNTGTLRTGGTGNAVTSNPGVYTDPGSLSGQQRMQNTLQTQSDLVLAVDNYITQFTNFINNPFNSATSTAVAQLYLNQATTLRADTMNNVNNATPILNSYITLENQYATADAATRTQIRSQQQALLQQFTAIPFTTQAQLTVYTNSWDALLSSGAGNAPITCDPFADPTCIGGLQP